MVNNHKYIMLLANCLILSQRGLKEIPSNFNVIMEKNTQIIRVNNFATKMECPSDFLSHIPCHRMVKRNAKSAPSTISCELFLPNTPAIALSTQEWLNTMTIEFNALIKKWVVGVSSLPTRHARNTQHVAISPQIQVQWDFGAI